jgi:hypothetical protein
MVSTATTFVVAVPAQIDIPTPASDPGGFDELQSAVNRSIGSDLATVFSEAVRARAHPKINQQNYDSIVQP